jgi:hypothetical protein
MCSIQTACSDHARLVFTAQWVHLGLFPAHQAPFPTLSRPHLVLRAFPALQGLTAQIQVSQRQTGFAIWAFTALQVHGPTDHQPPIVSPATTAH